MLAASALCSAVHEVNWTSRASAAMPLTPCMPMPSSAITRTRVAVASVQAAVSVPHEVEAAEIGTARAPALSVTELASAMRGSQKTPVIPSVMLVSPLFDDPREPSGSDGSGDGLHHAGLGHVLDDVRAQLHAQHGGRVVQLEDGLGEGAVVGGRGPVEVVRRQQGDLFGAGGQHVGGGAGEPGRAREPLGEQIQLGRRGENELGCDGNVANHYSTPSSGCPFEVCRCGQTATARCSTWRHSCGRTENSPYE